LLAMHTKWDFKWTRDGYPINTALSFVKIIFIIRK
jgi:hypothetical protein